MSKKYDVPENVNTFVAAKPQQCDIDRCLIQKCLVSQTFVNFSGWLKLEIGWSVITTSEILIIKNVSNF